MREITLFFEGHMDGEQRAADVIQESIFRALGNYRMNILQYQNQTRTENTKVAIGSPEKLEGMLDIPDFMKRQPT